MEALDVNGVDMQNEAAPDVIEDATKVGILPEVNDGDLIAEAAPELKVKATNIIEL